MRSLAEQIEHDETLFRSANHHHLTVVEVMVFDVGSPGGQATGAGWRLWCMNCDLRGGHLFRDRDGAVAVAKGLRSVAEPACQHLSARDTVPL